MPGPKKKVLPGELAKDSDWDPSVRTPMPMPTPVPIRPTGHDQSMPLKYVADGVMPAPRPVANNLEMLSLPPEEVLRRRRDALLRSRGATPDLPLATMQAKRDELLKSRQVEKLQAEKAALQRQLDEYLIQMEP